MKAQDALDGLVGTDGTEVRGFHQYIDALVDTG